MNEGQLRPRRTWFTETVFRLPGGTEDNDLWVHQDEATIRSVFVPTDEQRTAIAAGANLELIVWGGAQPPVAVRLNEDPIGKRPTVPGLCGSCDAGDCDRGGAGFVLTRDHGWLPACAEHLSAARSSGFVVSYGVAPDGASDV